MSKASNNNLSQRSIHSLDEAEELENSVNEPLKEEDSGEGDSYKNYIHSHINIENMQNPRVDQIEFE